MQGAMPVAKRVEEIMERNVKTIHCQRSVADAERLLVENRISGAPMVASDGHIMGVVSTTDIARFHRQNPTVNAEEALVYEIGTPETVTIEPCDSVVKAARTMVERGIHRLIVVQAGIPIGILSSLDIARLVANTREP
jgi:predicted transcriptional regulator